MYIPRAFAKTDKDKLVDFIRANSFGILFSQIEGGPWATHLPFWLESQEQSIGILWGHFAKANPHWKAIESDVLVVFSGPHAYISPTWYAAENTVPTWNYVAVHAYGPLTLVEEPAELLKIVQNTVTFYEAGRSAPWQLDTSREFYHKLLGGIVGFKIELTQLEGKWKLSQNQPVDRQRKVVAALQQSANQNDQRIAEIMAVNLSKESEIEPRLSV